MARRKATGSIEELIYVLIVLPIKLIVWIVKLPFRIYKHFKKPEQAPYEQPYDPNSVIDLTEAPKYKRKFLLTKREWNFYQALKPVADKLGLVVLSKIRMADLVEPVANNNSQYYQAFGKVKAKHVDFALARPENLYVELLIELDDSTHTPGNERDAFIESVYAAVGYKLLRVRTDIGLEKNIQEALCINPIEAKSDQ